MLFVCLLEVVSGTNDLILKILSLIERHIIHDWPTISFIGACETVGAVIRNIWLSVVLYWVFYFVYSKYSHLLRIDIIINP